MRNDFPSPELVISLGFMLTGFREARKLLSCAINCNFSGQLPPANGCPLQCHMKFSILAWAMPRANQPNERASACPLN